MPPPFKTAPTKKFTGWTPELSQRVKARDAAEPIRYIQNEEADRLEVVLLAWRVNVKLREAAIKDSSYAEAAAFWKTVYGLLELTLIPFEQKLVRRFTEHWLDERQS